MTGSYKLDRELDQRRERLAYLEQLEDPFTVAHLERLGVTAGWHCLEIGGGAGSIARWLCSRVGETGRVVVTDMDTRLLQPLAGPRCEVRRHDIGEEELEQGAFDLVHARNVLAHVPGRSAALRRMAAAAKPGGWVLLEEPDATTDGPEPTATAEKRELYSSVTDKIYRYLQQQDVDPFVGAALEQDLRGLGLAAVGAEGRSRVFRGGEHPEGSPHVAAFHQLRQTMVAAGAVADHELEAFFALTRDPAFAWREALTVAVWGRREGPHP